VAYVARRRISPGTLRYAINVSQRMDADLDLLCPPEAKGIECAIDHYRDDFQQAGVRWRLLHERLVTPWDIAHYVRKHRDVLFVVLSAEDTMARGLESVRADRYRCDVPWVIVADGLSPA